MVNKSKNKKKNKNKTSKNKQKDREQPRKKKDNNTSPPVFDPKSIEDSLLVRGVNIVEIEQFEKKNQTYPPTKTISEVFQNSFPLCEEMDHPLEINSKRRNCEKAKESEKGMEEIIKSTREAAEIHKQVRQYIQRIIKPGMRMVDICEVLENKNRELIGIDSEKPLKKGIGFPTGVSLNNVAAHYTPNSDDNRVLGKDDIVKIDFGTQVNGYIIDCAFTATFDEKYDEFINVVKEATYTGVKEMGIDVRLTDIGAAVEEVMTTEVEIDGKIHSVKPIRNLNGHSIGPYTIHAGKTVPITKNGDKTKMEEGELYAIETFGTTGKGYVRDSLFLETSHYMKTEEETKVLDKNSYKLLEFIEKNFGTLAFCRRWIDRAGITKYILYLKKLINAGMIAPYPPLEDIKGSYTAQYEHTVLLRPTCKEVLSRSHDF